MVMNIIKGQVQIATANARRNLKSMRQDISRFKRTLSLTTPNLQRLNKEISNFGVKKIPKPRNLNNWNIAASDSTRTLNKMNQSLGMTRGMIMSVGFAALFGGMMLKRVFGGALKAIFSSYKEVKDETSEFHMMTTQLTGAWEFFKFTLVDALMQTGLLQSMLNFVIRLVQGISRFTSKHPEITNILMIFMGLMTVIGILGIIIGQPILMLNILASQGALSAASVITSIIGIIGTVIILTAAVYLLTKIWTSDWSTLSKVIATIGTVLISVIGIMIAFGKTGTVIKYISKMFTFLANNPLVLVIMAIASLILVIYNLAKATGDPLAAFKFMASGIYKVLLGMVLTPINQILEGLQKITYWGWKAASALGMDGLANTMRKASNALADTQLKLMNLAESSVSIVEEKLGIDKLMEGKKRTLGSALSGAFLGSFGERETPGMPTVNKPTGEGLKANLPTIDTDKRDKEIDKLKDQKDKEEEKLEKMNESLELDTDRNDVLQSVDDGITDVVDLVKERKGEIIPSTQE